ncbi:MAG TPA: AsmA-like C-terminal region-containing protein [Lentimicrobium sp.]|nr:AsmA-like C-terminal region-containing protein [Lentimicrobium sp.]
MKRIIKITAIVIVFLILVMILIPFLFKGKIITEVKKAANENINAKMEFSDLSISLFRHFPNVAVSLDSLRITGIDEFKGDTLINVPDFSLSINLMSLFRGSNYEVRTIDVNNARIYLKVLSSGKANWDIVKEDTTAVVDTTAGPSNFKLSLQRFNISDSYLVYDDQSLKMFVKGEDIDLNLSGDLTETITDLDTKTSISRLDVDYDGIRYLNHAKAKLDSKITADLDKFKFTFPDAHLFVNDLEMLTAGYFAMPDDGFDMDIKFEAVKNDFKTFLSLVPAVYAKDFDKVKSSGNLAFNGYVKGKYNEKSMPAFGVSLDITNGMFKYPDLPGAVENINIKAQIDNKTGDPDATTINVPKFHLMMLQNPIDAVIYAKTPVSDPYLDATVKGRIDLADVSKVYPLEKGDQLSGLVVADFAVKGNQSDAENQRFKEFQAAGNVDISNLKYYSQSTPEGLAISTVKFILSPEAITMPVMNMIMGKNDISASGRISNYLAYAFDKGALRGIMEMQSGYFNVNDFMTEDSTVVNDTASSNMTVIEIPKNIEFRLNSSFKKVIYDKMELTNVTGVLTVMDQQLTLQNIKFNTMDGQMTLNGSYSTKNPDQPLLDMAMNISNIQVKQAFENFVTVKKLAPIARLTEGKISSDLKISTALGKDMMPQPATLVGNGNLKSPELVINNAKVFSKIADALKMEQFKRWAIEKVNLSFKIEAGKVNVKPFTTKIGNFNTEISGWNSFDQTLEYVLNMKIPRSSFGGAANNVLTNLVNQANSKGANFSLSETVPVAVIISGTVTDPKVRLSLTGTKEGLKETLKETIQQKKEEVITKAKEEVGKYVEEANAKAQQLLAEAQKKADQIVATGNQSAQKIRDEANNQANQLVAEGKKNGMVAELAAKKGAEKVKSEGDKRANDVMAEAKKQADAVMATARQQADKLIQDAKAKTK